MVRAPACVIAFGNTRPSHYHRVSMRGAAPPGVQFQLRPGDGFGQIHAVALALPRKAGFNLDLLRGGAQMGLSAKPGQSAVSLTVVDCASTGGENARHEASVPSPRRSANEHEPITTRALSSGRLACTSARMVLSCSSSWLVQLGHRLFDRLVHAERVGALPGRKLLHAHQVLGQEGTGRGRRPQLLADELPADVSPFIGFGSIFSIGSISRLKMYGTLG